MKHHISFKQQQNEKKHENLLDCNQQSIQWCALLCGSDANWVTAITFCRNSVRTHFLRELHLSRQFCSCCRRTERNPLLQFSSAAVESFFHAGEVFAVIQSREPQTTKCQCDPLFERHEEKCGKVLHVNFPSHFGLTASQKLAV